MIDLRFRELPDRIVLADGGEARVLTGFRTWIAEERRVREEGRISPAIFPGGRAPSSDWTAGALEFLASPNATPRRQGGGGPRAFDLVLDGDYIVAAFQQAYGVDLTDPGLDMHWHRFLALFTGLPESTLMAQIEGYRTWRGGGRSHDAAMADLRAAWRLPEREDGRVLEIQQSMFGGIAEKQLGGDR